MTPQELRDRIEQFAIAVVAFCRSLPDDALRRRITSQLQDAATSVAANYRAACRAQTKPAFIAKLSIAVEEADESVFWLDILGKSAVSGQKLSDLQQEAGELLAMLAASRKTATSRRGRNGRDR